MKEKLAAYLESKQGAWSDSTMKSEASRLSKLLPVLNGSPERLWDAIKTKAPYTRLTIFTRVADFWDFVQKGTSNANAYAKWKKEKALLFKHVYQPKRVSVTFQEARTLIAGIKDEGIREKALQLLSGGLRYTESLSVRDGSVIGKGGKARRVYVGHTNHYRASYHSFWRTLKKETGMTPHQLRKLCATELAKQPGMTAATLCAVMGWNDIATGIYYLQPQQENELQAVFNHINSSMEAANNEAKPLPGEISKAS
jgi:hypothetical protein